MQGMKHDMQHGGMTWSRPVRRAIHGGSIVSDVVDAPVDGWRERFLA